MGAISIVLLCLGILVLLGLGVAGFIIGIYNRLQKQNVLVDEAWSGIDVQLKKRFDLIPNLVETVKGYAKHEKGTFEKVTELRSKMMGTSSPEEMAKFEGELRSTLKSLFAVAENYPELKANENFLNLQNSLQEIETEIESSRRYYNGAVRDLNRMIIVFPTNIVANFLNLKKREFFEIADAAERENVKVDFSK